MFPSSNLVIISMSIYTHDNQAFQTPQRRFTLLKHLKVKGVSKCLQRAVSYSKLRKPLFPMRATFLILLQRLLLYRNSVGTKEHPRFNTGIFTL